MSAAAPKAALVQAAAHLSAASLPDRPAERGKLAADEIFSGAASKESSDDPTPGALSDPKPALSPATSVAPKVKKEPLLSRWKSAVTGNTGSLVLAGFAWNFLTIAAYSIIGPARGGLLLTKFGPDTLPWIYMGSALLTGAVVYVFNRFVRVPRKLLIGGSLTLLAVTLAGGALAVSAAAMPSVAIGYYLWTDVFGIMSTTLFWMYANDVFTRDESKRLFGFIAAGAPLGSIAGALLLKLLVGSMGPVPMLMIAAGIFAAVLPIFFFMEKRAKGRAAEEAPKVAAGAAPKGILKTILSSPFLIFLTALVALERLVPDITNYLYSVAAKASYGTDPTAMTQMFADVNLWTSLVSFAASTLFVGLTIRKLGISGALMTAGLANLILFALFPFMPTLGLAAVFFGLDGVTRYTWFKTAKESTYAATDRETLYRVKPVIEMFVYRFARFAAGLLLLAVAWLGGGAVQVALLGVPLALLWLYVSWRLGREHKKLEEAQK
ncbi:MAG: MFS transporter [Elusimicrobia bacterium]|nr:MFS transporter [Elusimicrobiota bacterium]